MRPVFILAAFHGCYDRLRQFWTADRYFQGGNLLLRSPVESGTTDSELFVGERFGNFSYFIPVVSGQYALTLRFAESTYSFELPGMSRQGGDLSRSVFDVYCNGTTLLRDFDVLKEAGGWNRPVVRSFRGLKPDAQGKLVLSFVPVMTHATIRAIEVEDDAVR